MTYTVYFQPLLGSDNAEQPVLLSKSNETAAEHLPKKINKFPKYINATEIPDMKP